MNEQFLFSFNYYFNGVDVKSQGNHLLELYYHNQIIIFLFCIQNGKKNAC